MDEYYPFSPNTPENLVLDPRGFLSVRIFFHRQPMEGLRVQFLRVAETLAGPTEALGTELKTDAQGKVFLPESVPLGAYVCRIEHQHPAYVPAVPDITQPYLLALPIGVAPYDILADREILDTGEA